MAHLEKIASFCQSIADSLWRLLLVALPVCIFISAGNAIMRKVTDFGSNAFLELQWYLFSAVFLLAAGSILKHDEHIRIDIFYAKFSKLTQAKINCILHSIFTVPILIFMIYLSVPFFLASISPPERMIDLIEIPQFILNIQYHETSPNAGGLSTWYGKILLPLGFIFLLFSVIADILKNFIFISRASWLTPTAPEEARSYARRPAGRV